MLYPKNHEKKLSRDLFQNPTAEYRGTPFWAWNCKLEQDLLNEEIEHMKTMGLGGFHMHSRSGMATDYLSPEFMQRVKDSVEKAKSLNMLAWLYDEDRWPSGGAGGLVTGDPGLRARYLLFTPNEYDMQTDSTAPGAHYGYLLARYDVKLEKGCLSSYRRLPEGEEAEHDLWYAYLQVCRDDPWFNNAAYVDTLNPKAIEKFVEVTHQAYYEAVGEEFGGTIPAIFTDEPQFTCRETLDYADAKKEVKLPFTDNLPRLFMEKYGYDLMDKLPELYWELPEGRVSVARYHYHDFSTELFTSAFADTIGKWCREHHILLTGHMMNEPTLTSQTLFVGEAMRSYRGFGLPGIDLLCDSREFNTAKQAQSASRQYGCPGVLSELYGVTGWDFDFRGHKLQGDWQAALGITVRVHHLYWASMAGEAKRDYPASIGHQSPWYKEYAYIEDHFARVNTAMTRGKAHVRLGVIHPIESYWLHWGAKEQTEGVRREMDSRFENLTNWLLFNTMDFDFICESLLPGLYNQDADGFGVGEMSYDAVLVPFCETLRSTTLAALKEFASRGGKVIFAGEPPRYLDALPSEEAAKLAASTLTVPFTEYAILNAVEELREIEIRDAKGVRSDNLFVQMRQDGDVRWLFISHVHPPRNQLVARPEYYKITIKGEYKPVLYDTMTGEVSDLPAVVREGSTVIEWNCFCHDSLLLALEPGNPAASLRPKPQAVYAGEVRDKLPVTLLEPNALLLDIAEYALDEGDWESAEEILRLDDILHIRLGWPTRNTGFAQPWSVPYAAPSHTLKLRFTFESEIPLSGVSLAMEDPELAVIELNGQAVSNTVTGHFVDAFVKTVALPHISAGQNTLILTLPYGIKSNVEWCYLLGDFGVAVQGRHCTITKPVRELSFGDIVPQGLPFYSGNLVYHAALEGRGKETILEFPQFLCPALTVEVDGRRAGIVALAPYKVSLGVLEKGMHKVDITLQNSRVNAFGAVHNCDDQEKWYGPGIWRTTENAWSYEYNLKKIGIMVAPRIYTVE